MERGKYTFVHAYIHTYIHGLLASEGKKEEKGREEVLLSLDEK